MPKATPSGPMLPLLSNRVVGVDPELHSGLRLNRDAGFGFAARAQFVPLGLDEIEAAAQDCPVLFTAGSVLHQGGNLFVEADGAWKRATYIPAYVRAFPFVLVKTQDSNEVFLGMDPDASDFNSAEGDPLFNDDKPSKALNEAIALTSAVRNSLLASEEFAHTLDQAGLLELEEATINFTNGGTALVRGFKVEKLSDETFLSWRRRNWIPPIYAHLFSMRSWARLMEAAAAQLDLGSASSLATA